MGIEYLKIDIDACVAVGAKTAGLLAYLDYISKELPKDERGFFRADSAYIEKGIGFPKTTFVRHRAKLIKAGLIEYLPGNNQNAKPRYKVIK